MKKLKSGLIQAVSSALIGLIVTAVVGFLAAREWIPSYSPILLAIFNIATNVFTMTRIRRWGLFYTIGWLGGSLIFNALGFFDPIDLVLNVVAPIVIVFVRLALWIKNSTSKVFSKSKG